MNYMGSCTVLDLIYTSIAHCHCAEMARDAKRRRNHVHIGFALCCCASNSSNHVSHSNVSRRECIRLMASFCAAALVRPAKSEAPYLPAGAAEFSRVLAAKTRWAELGGAISNGNELTDTDWNNTRTYLRAFYAIGNDMRILAKPWDKDKREIANNVASKLQSVVKGMDPAARDHDVTAFLESHKLAADQVDKFLTVFTDAVSGDIPDEL